MQRAENHESELPAGALWTIVRFPFIFLRFFIGYSIVVLIRLPLIFIASMCCIFSLNNKLAAGIFEFDEECLEKINKWMWGNIGSGK